MTRRTCAAAVMLAVVVAACGGGDDDAGTGDATGDRSGSGATASTVASEAPEGTDGATAGAGTDTAGTDTSGAAATGDEGGAGGTPTDGDAIDYEALGLWDDGPCDASLDPLVVGNISPHESPVLSLQDHVLALEAAVEAFNARGGANGTCLEVVACDDQNDFDSALECARELDDSGVVATLNDADTIAAGELSAAMADAGIPRIGGNVAPDDWAAAINYPIGATSAVVFLLPDALLQQGVTDIGVVRVDLPAAAAAKGLFEATYGDDGAAFPADVPVPAGTTDYTQFVLAAENAGADGIMLAVGEQEAIQVARAAQQLGSDLPIAASLGSFAYSNVTDLGDAAAQMTFVWSSPPATADIPVYRVMRADLAASGADELQTENLKAGAILSWISTYGLLAMIRDAGLTDFSREAVSAMVDAAVDVPMLGMFGDESWTPSLDQPGAWKRVGIGYYSWWKWDPDAEWDGSPGNFVFGGVIDFAATLCGSPLGGPEPC